MRTLKQVAKNMADAFTRYGLWKGGGSGGSSALADMTDVSFSNLKENDLLKYNGSIWVNSDNIHEYSTEEKVVGKWIDGKYIYEKVINGGYLLNNSTKYIDVSDLNIDFLIQLNGMSYKDDKSAQYPITLGSNGTSAVQIDFINNNIRITTWANWSAYNSIIIIQYTKTTK